MAHNTDMTQAFRLAAQKVRRRLRAIRLHNEVKPEEVHQLRVATRRAHAKLWMLKSSLSSRSYSWWKKTLRELRKSTGTLRDLDVIFENHHTAMNDSLRDFLLHSRSKACDEMQEILSNIHGKTFKREMESLPTHGMIDDGSPEAFELRTRSLERLSQSHTALFIRSSAACRDPAALHELRIAVKKLRYLLETISESRMADKPKALLDDLKAMQERLGKIHDHQFAESFFNKLADESDNEALRIAANEFVTNSRNGWQQELSQIPSLEEFVARLQSPLSHLLLELAFPKKV